MNEAGNKSPNRHEFLKLGGAVSVAVVIGQTNLTRAEAAPSQSNGVRW
jgi:hypothetical protein